MKAKASLKYLLLLIAAAMLSACGGSSSDSDGGFTPQGIRVTATPQSVSVASGTTTDITVRVTESGGAAIREGTVVSAAVSPAANGTVVSVDGAGTLGGSQIGTVGGNANFRFRGTGAGGPATVTFSVVDPNAPARTETAVVNLTVTPPGPDNRLILQATTTTLPINAFNVQPFVGSPFMAEVTVTVRSSSGQLQNTPDGIQVSVNPVGSTGGFSTLDDGSTTVNEFTQRLGQGPVDVVAGKATIFVHSFNLTGTTTLTVTTRDPDTQQTVSATLIFNIVSSISNLPARVVINPPLSPIYVQGSGGNTSTQIELLVLDGIGQPVPNPVAGNNAFNNVRVELVGDAASGGARVSGVNAQGQNVQGTSISLRTLAGVSGVLLTSGTQIGSAQIRVTSDRADNNVDNGISDPVSELRTVFVSDGVLFDLEITQPFVNAIIVNPVDPSVMVTPGTTTIPPSPDGTYSITVGVIATDRLGNPVLPGTAINFGLIDEPQATGAGDFLIAGTDGNPQENGLLFTAPTGRFTTAGGGAGPGDAVVILSENDPANRDLEGARVIQTVNGPGSLTVQRRFNRNDVTGSTVDAGNALQYVIGRAADGNISANAVTNELGVARTTLNYPVSRIGKFALVWAQGNGAIVAGQARTVADAEFLRFAGVAPATLLISPSVIPGNTTQSVRICVRDALNAPIQSVQVGFAFEALTTGQGRVDGQAGPGNVAALTGRDGCTTATVVTSGVSASGGMVRFSAVGQSGTVTIEIGTLILTANPPSLLGGSGVITLRLVDGSGNPIGGVQLSGTCTSMGGATISTEPPQGNNGVTNANGEALFSIIATNLNQPLTPGSGSCVYRVPSGTPSVTVPVQGVDTCLTPTSPPDGRCPNSTFTLSLTLTGNRGGAISLPSGITCSHPGGAGNTQCAAPFQRGIQVLVRADTVNTNSAPTPVFTGECTVQTAPGDPDLGGPLPATATGQTVMSGNRSCAINFP